MGCCSTSRHWCAIKDGWSSNEWNLPCKISFAFCWHNCIMCSGTCYSFTIRPKFWLHTTIAACFFPVFLKTFFHWFWKSHRLPQMLYLLLFLSPGGARIPASNVWSRPRASSASAKNFCNQKAIRRWNWIFIQSNGAGCYRCRSSSKLMNFWRALLQLLRNIEKPCAWRKMQRPVWHTQNGRKTNWFQFICMLKKIFLDTIFRMC